MQNHQTQNLLQLGSALAPCLGYPFFLDELSQAAFSPGLPLQNSVWLKNLREWFKYANKTFSKITGHLIYP